MDEHSACALQYGQLGKAVYVPETQSWNFTRSLTQPSLISYTGTTKTAVESPLTAPQSSLVEKKSLLPKIHPELAASWSLIGNDVFSHVITTTSEVCDSQVSSLMDIGNAVDIDNDDSGGRVVPVAVFASGECGNSISFRRLEENTCELVYQATSVRVPSIGGTDTIEWPTGGAPVRQICFARTVEEKAAWMAARFPNSTTIFRPLFRRDPVPMRMYHGHGYVFPKGIQNSRLDANPLVSISNLQTGGFAHADITFNPWYQRQFAIVDQRGNWGIWDISGRNRRVKGNWSATCVRSGALPWLDVGDEIVLDNKPRHDGWAAVEWAGDVNALLVCDRRCSMLYRMEGDQVWPVPIELGLKRKSEWILDLKRSSSDACHAFILTTTRIFYLEITPSADLSAGGPESTLYPRLSWRHYRDPEDTTLRLSSLLTNEEFYIFLHSRLNHFVLGFQCPSGSEGASIDTVSMPDPFILDVPATVDVPMESQISRNATQFSTLVFKEIAHSPTAAGKLRYNLKERLVKLFLLDWRLAVHELVYTGSAIAPDAWDEQPLGREALRVKKRQKGVRKNQKINECDDFIVDDWDESVSGAATSALPDSGVPAVRPRASPQWTIDYTTVYSAAAGKLVVKPSEGEVQQQSEEQARQAIDDLKDKLANAALSDQPASRTLLEIFGNSPVLDDIDANARVIEEITSLCENHTSDPEAEYQIHVLPSSIAISPMLDFETTDGDGKGKPNLLHIYDRLVNDWLANLPHDIAGRTRITKEKVIRRLAVDLILARINISHKPFSTGIDYFSDQQTKDLDEAESSNPESTVESHGTGTSRRPSLSASEKGGTPDRQSSKENRTPVYSSLSTLTTFTSKPSKSRNTKAILSHWVPGVDPATYSWQRTVQSMEDDGRKRISRSATPKRRSRTKTPQSIPMSSPAPTIAQEFGSQPTGAPSRRGFLQSSQVTGMEEDLPMTQVERGLFGGREANKKTALKSRKKKRAAGF